MHEPRSEPDISADLLSRPELLERGWTDAAIRRFLGEPDARRTNPRYRSAAPMRLYRAERVRAVEETAAFASWLFTSRKRSAAASAASNARRDDLLIAIEAWQPQVVVQPYEHVRRRAIAAYNAHNEYRESASEHDDPAFIERITLNYVRHRLTDYEETLAVLRGRPGAQAAYERGRQRLTETILVHYPMLRAAHERQQAHRARLSPESG